ncbi:MAG: oligosaccharide flippase family protein [Dehalococcoidales bacterium]
MHGIKKVLENSILYTFSSLLVKAINFLLLPIYTIYLTPTDYGIINLISGFTSVLSIIIMFSLHAAIVRFYVEFKSDREKLKRFHGTVIVFVFISGCTFVLLMLTFRNYVTELLFAGIPFYPYVAIALAGVVFSNIHTIHQYILRGMQSGKKLTAINLFVFTCNAALTIVLIGVFRLGVVGVLSATLAVNFLYSGYALLDLKRNNLICVCFDTTLIIEMLKYSIPIMPHNLSTNIASFASRLFINKSASLVVVGLYSVAMQFGTIVDTIQGAVSEAYTPWFYNMLEQEGQTDRKIITVVSKYLLILYSFVYLGIGLFSQEVLFLMTTESFHRAWTVIPILVVAYSVKSIYYFYINILFYHKQAANKIFISTITGSLADIILASVLVKSYGMYGAAVAFLIAKIIVVAIVVIMSGFYDDVGFRIRDMLKVIIPSHLFMMLGLYLSYTKYIDSFSFLNFLYKILILILYAVYIYLKNHKELKLIIEQEQLHVIFKSKFGKTLLGKIAR